MGLDLIYCAGGNARFTQIAYEEGWKLGVRSDKWHFPYPLTFVDVDYKKPDFERHLARVAKERPRFATVPDLSDKEVSEADIERAVHQAERLRDYCEVALVVPKLTGQIELLPPELAIGYSVPTSYGGAQYPIWELSGRKVHLLGGNPHEQLKIYRYIAAIGEVISLDGNFVQKIALEYCMFWVQGGRLGGKWFRWPEQGTDQQYPCFRESLKNVKKMWEKEAVIVSDV